MASQIHIVRHAESVHNVTKDFTKLDPSLTDLGFEQAGQLVQNFPESSSIGVIITSPLKRAVQTTLAGFPHVLEKSNFALGSNPGGIENGAKLIVDPDLQERSDLPCDTGSDRSVLETTFPGVDFGAVESGWQSKEGAYSADDESVKARAYKVRRRLAALAEKLKNEQKKDIVVVTHGVFMKFLSGDPNIDLPKAGWNSYTIEEDSSGDAVLRQAV
ncbi:phosphoglycerate mutase-like protein [Tothia fuscella]|uniref:Phosphoglycerate mutase-like protein n=1 Tax=Tothia fuscella TaxID=1048955 RepID=A0A9P4U194_9PEZI|nr:phosphoglycerate mutase-like protein [Tothia fuscella]